MSNNVPAMLMVTDESAEGTGDELD